MEKNYRFQSDKSHMKYEYYDFAGRFPRTKKNFLRENIKHIKEMQGILQTIKNQPSMVNKRAPKMLEKLTNVVTKVPSNVPTMKKSGSTGAVLQNKPKLKRVQSNSAPKVVHRAMQTERTEDINKIYENGTIKFASNAVPVQKSPILGRGSGDVPQISDKMQLMDLEERRNYIKENIRNVQAKLRRHDIIQNPLKVPSNYQIGEVPKYLKERKEDTKPSAFSEAYPGLVLLPEEERKEYLRVARQNYADLIKELNLMPVKNDTLKQRKRKIEIEDELKKIDEVIKVFQKPKVFVKADE